MARIPPVEQTFYYAAPPAEVFAALTEPKELTKWFLEKAAITLRKGGAFKFTWLGGFSMKGKVKSVASPKQLVLNWVDRLPDGKLYETVAQFDLQKKGKGTLLTVTHRGFKKGRKWIGLYGAVQSGWAYYLTNLRSLLEHGVDLRSGQDALS